MEVPDIEVIMLASRGIAYQQRKDGDPEIAGFVDGLVDLIESYEPILEAALRYTNHYNAEDWPAAMEAVVDIRREISALADLPKQTA